MKIKVINQHILSVKVIILSFLQNEDLENLLQKFCQEFAVDFDLLKYEFKAESKKIHNRFF